MTTTPAPSRTIVLPAAMVSNFALPGSTAVGLDGQWPTAKPNLNLDYYLDATAPMTEVGDRFSSVSIDIMPSGSGEMVATKPGTVGPTISVWLAGGVPGRSYIVRYQAVGTTGRNWEWLIGLSIDAALASYPLAKPPSAGFGAPVAWNVPAFFSFDFSIPENSWLFPFA